MTTPSVADGIHALWSKGIAELSGGAYMKGATVHRDNRSKYNKTDPGKPASLSMGIVQAILAVLNGLVETFSWSGDGEVGTATLHTSGTRPALHSPKSAQFTWDEQDPDAGVYGGFKDKANYKLAVLNFITCYLDGRRGGSPRSEEVMERWRALQGALALARPAHAPGSAWDKGELAALCREPAVRTHIERVADALWFAMAYRLPHTGEAAKRELLVSEDQVASPGPWAGTLSGTDLLTLPAAAVPTPAAIPVPAGGTVAGDGGLVGGNVLRITRALRRRLPTIVVGPTGLGKTTIVTVALMDMGYGIELAELDEGWKGDDLEGGYARGEEDGEWHVFPGPIMRWAERAAAGEQVALIIDELAQGNRTVRSKVHRLMKLCERREVEAMRLPVPDGEDGPFYVVDVKVSMQRFVIPAHRVIILAMCNQGEGYDGLDLRRNPAFGRRWRGGWLQLKDYSQDEEAMILGIHLHLDKAAPLIKALVQVQQLVRAEYQHGAHNLLTELDLATLISWGQMTLDYERTDGFPPGQAFLEAARDCWIGRICPYLGAQLDPAAEQALEGHVTRQHLLRLTS